MDAEVIARNLGLLTNLAQFGSKPRHLPGEWYERVLQAAADRLVEYVVLEWGNETARTDPRRIVVTLTVRGRGLSSTLVRRGPGKK